jgi:UDP-N-acetylmuramate dehydrogenase
LNIELTANLLKELIGKENVRTNEPMKNHTSFKVGGNADILVMPEDAEQLKRIMAFSSEENIPLFIMGNGSNLIVSDKGIRGITAKLSDNFCKCTVRDDVIEAEAGILLSKIAHIALEHELSGLEFASGIPGTLGGAVFMNAGAYGGEMKDVVTYTQYLDRSGNLRSVEGEAHQFGYRASFIQKEGGIVIKSGLKLRKADKSEIKALMDDLNRRRKEKQPLHLPSAGSVFKRPEGYFAGKLVEDCGLKGFSIGGAEVSEMHCGFIVNTNNAKAADIINLIEHIQNTVKCKFGIELKTEVRIVGEQ